MGLKHLYHSPKADPADATIIGATKWNDDHYYVDGAGAPVGNVGAVLLAGAAGALTHLNSVAAGSVLTSAGVGALPVWAAPSGGGVGPGSAVQVDRLGVGVAPPAGSGQILAAAFVAVGANPASLGTIRLPNAGGGVMFRNGAGTGDIAALQVDGANNAVLGDLGLTPQLYLDAATTVNIRVGSYALALNTGGFFTQPTGTVDLGHPAGTLRWRSAWLSEKLNLLEVAAPAAPGANTVNVWLQDNGSGKSQLMVRFATGAAIQLAIEP